MKTFFWILWLIREEYLEFIKNFSPVVILLSLFSIIFAQIDESRSTWHSVEIF